VGKELQELLWLKIALDIVLGDISKEFILISKWGCGGSTGHSEYRKRSLEDDSESDVFTKSLVPPRLYSIKTSGDKVILRQNPRPSLVRHCRPIRMQIKKKHLS